MAKKKKKRVAYLTKPRYCGFCVTSIKGRHTYTEKAERENVVLLISQKAEGLCKSNLFQNTAWCFCFLEKIQDKTICTFVNTVKIHAVISLKHTKYTKLCHLKCQNKNNMQPIILSIAKSMRTPDHHTCLWFFSKHLPQIWNCTIVQENFSCVPNVHCALALHT